MSHPLWSFFNSPPSQTNSDLAVFSKAPCPRSHTGPSNLKKRQALLLDHWGDCSAGLWALCVQSSRSVYLCRSSTYHSPRKSLQRLYKRLFNEQVNKWMIVPILEMEEPRPREIQFNLSPHFFCFLGFFWWGGGSILMGPSWTGIINDASEAGVEDLDVQWWAQTSAVKDTEPCPS